MLVVFFTISFVQIAWNEARVNLDCRWEHNKRNGCFNKTSWQFYERSAGKHSVGANTLSKLQ